MTDIEEAKYFMKRSGWLSRTPPFFADALLSRCTLGVVERGQCDYRMGDPPDGLRGVVSGEFAFEIAPHEQGPHLAHVFRAGFWFGELELFAGIPHVASIMATRRSVVLHLDQANLKALVAEQVEAWRWIGLLSSEHLALALGVISDGLLRDPDSRIAALLLRLADVRDADQSGDPELELDITQDDLAQLANVSRATVFAHLSELENAGLIARAYGRVTLLDPARLRQRIAAGING